MESNKIKEIILRQIKKRKKIISLAIFFTLAYILTQVFSPWPLKLIFDHILLTKPLPPSLGFLTIILELGQFSSVIIFSGLIILIALFKGLFSYYQLFLTSRFSYKVVHDIQNELFIHIQKLPLSFHKKTKSGELITRLINDTHILKDAFGDWIFTLSTDLLIIIAMFVFMFFLNWQLALVAALIFPLMFFNLIVLYQSIRSSTKKQRKKEGKIANRISEVLSSIPIIQAFNRDIYEQDKFNEETHSSLKRSIKVAKKEATMIKVAEIISSFGTVFVIIYGSLLVLQGEILPGELLIFTSYLTSMYKPIRQSVKLSTKLSKAWVAQTRINKLLSINSELKDIPNAIKAENIEGKIEFKNVNFGYEKNQKIIDNVSFTILPKQTTVLTGSSGSGKSTIISLILRMFEITNGIILLDDIDIKKYQIESIRSHISVVFQDSILFGTSIYENIKYGNLHATSGEIINATKLAHVHDFITSLNEGYDTIISERGTSLSGGQKQRICLARAIVKNSPILILDEPTASLDKESQRLIWDTIAEIKKNKTILIVNHDIRSLDNIADKIITISNKKIIKQENQMFNDFGVKKSFIPR